MAVERESTFLLMNDREKVIEEGFEVEWEE